MTKAELESIRHEIHTKSRYDVVRNEFIVDPGLFHSMATVLRERVQVEDDLQKVFACSADTLHALAE